MNFIRSTKLSCQNQPESLALISENDAWAGLGPYMEDTLNKLPFNAEPDLDALLSRDQFFRLTRKIWSEGITRTSHQHAFLSHDVSKWTEMDRKAEQTESESGKHVLRNILERPGSVHQRDIEIFMDNFFPVMTIVSIQSNDGKNRVYSWGDIEKFKPTIPSLDLEDYLIPYSITRRAWLMEKENEMRLCRHSMCDYYEQNLCCAYMNPPVEDHNDCLFPSMLQRQVSFHQQRK